MHIMPELENVQPSKLIYLPYPVFLASSWCSVRMTHWVVCSHLVVFLHYSCTLVLGIDAPSLLLYLLCYSTFLLKSGPCVACSFCRYAFSMIFLHTS